MLAQTIEALVLWTFVKVTASIIGRHLQLKVESSPWKILLPPNLCPKFNHNFCKYMGGKYLICDPGENLGNSHLAPQLTTAWFWPSAVFLAILLQHRATSTGMFIKCSSISCTYPVTHSLTYIVVLAAVGGLVLQYSGSWSSWHDLNISCVLYAP